MKKFGRRTVLQLNEKKAEKKPDKPIGLSGLVQYGNDNSESEEEEENEVSVTPTQMPASPAEQNGQVDQPPTESNQASVEKKEPDHMDNQLADFLAEIESISKDETEAEEVEGSTSHVETAAADSTSATPHTSKQITPATSSGESETDEEEEEEPMPDLEKPTEPKSAWQHCLDEGTQHYYYWNTVTNAVTWEIPEDYSKYLLLLKEYEEKLAKYEKVMKEWEERKNQPKEKKKKSKEIRNGASSPSESDRPKPLVDYKIETPDMKPNVELVTNKYGRGLGFSEDDGQATPYAPRHRATYPVSFVKGETVTNKLPELIPKVSRSEPSATRNVTKLDRSSPAPVAPSSPETVKKVSSKSDTEEQGSDEESEPVQGPQLPSFASASSLGEPVCNGKEDASKDARPESDMEVEDFDLDDIDRQLELALEKKMDGKSKKKRRLESKEDSDITKKKRSNDPSLPAGPLQPRPPAQPPADKVIKNKNIQEDVKLRAEVDEFARDISDKLESLEVSRKSMTQLQILLIETETRIADWRDGGIESSFMLRKLQEAGKQLKRYESTAAPPGWSCHWDRTYKRYYYFHNTTGESSWEYPEDETKDNVTSSQVPAPPSHHPGQHLGQSTVQPPPPPSSAPISRDQPIHFAGLTAAPPPPPPSHPAPPSAAPFPDSTASASSYVLPPGLANPPPPPSSSPPPTPPGTSPPPPDGPPGDTDTHSAQNETMEDDDGNVISAAPQIRQNIDLNDGQSLDDMPVTDAPDGEVDELPTHSTSTPPASSTSQSSASALPELSSSAAGAAKEKKKKKKLGTGLAMKKKGVGNLVQKWQQIQEEVATKQND